MACYRPDDKPKSRHSRHRSNGQSQNESTGIVIAQGEEFRKKELGLVFINDITRSAGRLVSYVLEALLCNPANHPNRLLSLSISSAGRPQSNGNLSVDDQQIMVLLLLARPRKNIEDR